jgi:tetratricopeptide (TPR) repeat protein
MKEYGRLESERRNIMAMLDYMVQKEKWDDVIRMSFSILPFLYDVGYWSDYQRVADMGLAASEASNDQISIVDFLVTSQSFLSFSLKKYDLASAHAKKGLSLARKIDHQKGIALALRILGLIYRDKGSYEEARDFLQEGYYLCLRLGEHDLAKHIEGSLSVVLRRLGDHDGAIKVLLAELAVAQTTGESIWEAMAKCRLGTVYYEKGEYKLARNYYLQAVEIEEKLGRKVSLAFNYKKLALTELASKKYDDAMFYAIKSKDLFKDVGSADDVQQIENLIADILKK